MPEGGEWKALLRASEAGEIPLIQYHLSNGVDPNWQHPEYFTAPLFEAIRNGQDRAVEILLQGAAYPLLVEEMTGCSPLEVAMQEREHGIVDLLLDHIPHRQERAKHVKSILLTGKNDISLVEYILNVGHKVILANGEAEDVGTTNRLKDITGNMKLKWISQEMNTSDFEVASIDVWMHQNAHHMSIDQKLGSLSRLISEDTRKIRIEPSIPPRPPVEKERHEFVVVKPNSLRYQLTSYWWYTKYLEIVLWVATSQSEEVKGRLFNHRGERLSYHSVQNS
eukprot:CAMPEP_0194207310 /NCGR_PEP_ID=MMETSP0156-20130528/6082_1 /TAXON_ID=33649 /ORGANISM="Thalassionema nitzschioides, Strain L26-B" /LENGTH=279 /DNA_ID=CAMNT_0038934033 /DNA_START=84 /DNA_END=923 /DNA_ORIENTATION=-